ncbi:DOMON-like domain-containing protein [Methylomicrobium lacus]|uniref:DOMON-like domain-containing protein n=1 Tax=Methylomicrobium lacus TaxID=136992 RepID=UPI0035A90B55
MPNLNLLCHPDTPSPAIDSLQVELERCAGNAILLHYRLTGDLSRILIPAPKPAAETDGLWQHTCFELFVAKTGTPAYYEFNFSPSGQWAAYAFGAYRQRRPWTLCRPPVLALTQTRNELMLTAKIAAPELPFDGGVDSLQLGLSAVVESTTGDLSYWALRHPGDRPDFHDRAGFVCRL